MHVYVRASIQAFHEPLYRELTIDACDDAGAERPELAAVVKYGASAFHRVHHDFSLFWALYARLCDLFELFGSKHGGVDVILLPFRRIRFVGWLPTAENLGKPAQKHENAYETAPGWCFRGTFLADAIAVCLAAAPRETRPLPRHLALAKVPKPGEDPVMSFQI